MHYEVELRELVYERADGGGGLRIAGAAWTPMRRAGAGDGGSPARFYDLRDARAFVRGVDGAAVRLVEVRRCGRRDVLAPARPRPCRSGAHSQAG